MSNVYLVGDDGKTVPMSRVHCSNEERELQILLEMNPQLMPGDQIRPDDPRRWLLIKREMPVPDPSSGESRWSIDHFFVDQSAIPTFVECKRFLDTRSRREVVGQMLDYAANGHWYWGRDEIRQYASETAKRQGSDIEQALKQLSPDTDGGVEEFLDQVENNLREGQIRLVFFMEEAPQELKSIVDFLNKQMERSEVLIVEARQFESAGMKVVAPSLFGFTEEARRVKKTVTVTSGQRRKWDETLYFDDARGRLNEDVEAIEKVYLFLQSAPCTIRWGGGKKTGSFSCVVDAVGSGSIFSVYSDGTQGINFGYVGGSPKADAFRDELARVLRDEVGLPVPAEPEGKFSGFKIGEWGAKTSLLLESIGPLISSLKHS